MTTHKIYCEYHLGDNFSILHLLRHLAIRHPDHQFEFYAHLCHLPEFLPLVQDTPNLNLFDLERGIPDGAINGWKQADAFWASHPLKNDYAAFTRRYYRRLTRKLGFNDPIPDLLFDFPCLEKRDSWPVDYQVLVVNSNPQSAQFLDYTHEDSLDPMIEALSKKHIGVITTKYSPYADSCTLDANAHLPRSGLKCFEIAQLANRIPIHIMVSTGPSWLTMNKWSQPKYRLIMCQNEHVNLVPHVWARTISQAMDELRKAGLI